MERNDNELFDQLVREKLTGYMEPPEPEWIKNIHAKKSRVINLYHLYRLMLITALVGAGIFASVQFVPYASTLPAASQQNELNLSSQGESLSKSSANQNDYSYESSTSQALSTEAILIEAPVATPHSSENSKAGIYPVTRSGSNSQNKDARKTDVRKKTKATNTTTLTLPEKTVQPDANKPTDGLKEDKQSVPVDETKKKIDNEQDEASENCKASFEYYSSYTGEINFINTSSGNGNPVISWTFGDGRSSTETEPKHSYLSSGQYEVTLRVKDPKSGCEAMQTKVVAFRNPNDKFTPITISGELHAGTSPVKDGLIEVYRFNEQKGGFVLSTTLRTSQSGAYSVVINRNERYVLRGVPSSEWSDYTPSFWGNTDNIENASEIVVMPSEKENLLGYNIELALAEKQKTSDELKGEPITSSTDQSVLLLDQNNNIVGVGKVDVNGDYIFTGSVPPGDYKVVNPANGASSAKTVTEGEPVRGSIFDRNSGSVSAKNDEKVSVFPNPAGNTVNFGINSSAEETATIILTDAAGVELSRKQMVFTSGFNQTQYDLSNYSPGIYYVLVFKGNQQVLSNRLVKMIDTGK